MRSTGHDACVIAQQVDRAEAPIGQIGESLDAVLISDVAAGADRLDLRQVGSYGVDHGFSGNAPCTYKATRDGLSGAAYSTKLSPWLATGALSARTVFAALKAYEARHGANPTTPPSFAEVVSAAGAKRHSLVDFPHKALRAELADSSNARLNPASCSINRVVKTEPAQKGYFPGFRWVSVGVTQSSTLRSMAAIVRVPVSVMAVRISFSKRSSRLQTPASPFAARA